MLKCSTAVARILTIGMLTVFAGSAAAQHAYPDKPIRIISPYAPGGNTSLVARLIGQKLTERWGQQVIVDNRPGGNTIIGSEALAKSKPDGYTLMLTASVIASNPNLYTLPYDTIKDFAPITTVTRNEYLLVVHPSLPAKNFKELIALAKSRPGQLNYGAVGTGTLQHLAGELLGILTGTKFQHIPYKGSGPILPDVMGGQIEMAFMNPLNVVPNIKAGQVRAIAISGDKRVSALPDVPTFAEEGLSDYEIRNWFGIFAPARTPKEIVDKLAAELAEIMTTPEMRERLAGQGAEPFVSTPERFAAYLKAEIAKFGRIIKAANVKRPG